MAKVASGQPMRSAERLLQVLKCFDSGPAPLSISDISRRLDLAASTVRRLLVILEQHGFIRQDPAAGHYRLHHAVIRLAATALAGSSLVKVAAPLLDELNAVHDEAVHLTLRDGAEVIIIDQRRSGHLVKTFHSIGHRYAAYKGSAAGKALLAWLPEPELRRILPESGRWEVFTDRAPRDLQALGTALAETRERGYGLNEAETEAGVWSVAAPVRDHSGAVAAALNMPCPESRLSEDRRSALSSAVVNAAKTLSASLPFID